MEDEIRKLRRSLVVTQSLCILMLAMFLAVIVIMLQGVRVFQEYRNDIDTTITLVKDLKKINLPKLAEDMHTTSEAINSVDWTALSEQLNELDLQEIKNTIDSLDLDQINETLGSLDLDELVHSLDGLDIDKINQTMDDIQSALDKLNRFGLF